MTRLNNKNGILFHRVSAASSVTTHENAPVDFEWWTIPKKSPTINAIKVLPGQICLENQWLLSSKLSLQIYWDVMVCTSLLTVGIFFFFKFCLHCKSGFKITFTLSQRSRFHSFLLLLWVFRTIQAASDSLKVNRRVQQAHLNGKGLEGFISSSKGAFHFVWQAARLSYELKSQGLNNVPVLA